VSFNRHLQWCPIWDHGSVKRRNGVVRRRWIQEFYKADTRATAIRVNHRPHTLRSDCAEVGKDFAQVEILSIEWQATDETCGDCPSVNCARLLQSIDDRSYRARKNKALAAQLHTLGVECVRGTFP